MIRSITTLIVFLFLISQVTFSQDLMLNNAESSLTVSGTSNLHDWNIKGQMFKGEGSFIFDNEHLKMISELTFEVVVAQLKADKDGMNKTIQKALKAAQQPTITYKFEKLILLTEVDLYTYTAETSGFLTIAGLTKPINLLFNISVLNHKIRFKGTKNLKMSDFNIDPPKAMLGMLKSGNEILVKFDVVYQ